MIKQILEKLIEAWLFDDRSIDEFAEELEEFIIETYGPPF